MILIYILTGLILSLGIISKVYKNKSDLKNSVWYTNYIIVRHYKYGLIAIILNKIKYIITVILFIWIGIASTISILNKQKLKHFQQVKLECNGWTTKDCGIKAYEQNDWLRKAKLQRTKIFRIFVPKQVEYESEIYSGFYK